jgi:GT2 family glycosyltransferase/lipopolysaccharide/colanic/teichoic acid biosynthesis glycosyltransferase
LGEAKDLSVIVVGYNSSRPLSACLDALARNPAANADTETIVVDNNSSDGTATLVRENFPGVRLFENSTNLGYSRAVNQGIREARGRYILVLNPDVTVLPGALDRLLEFMDSHPAAAIAGAKLLNEDGSVQESCRRFYTFWTLILRRTFLGTVFRNGRTIRRYLMRDFDHEEPREVDWVIGACMTVRREALADIGLMDERFFLYFEDVDWCYRTWHSGWKVFYVSDAVMRHRYARESARSGFSRQLLAHLLSLLHFYEKWGKVLYRMKRYRGVMRRTALLLADVVAINGAFALSYAIRSSLRGFLEKPMFGVQVYGTFLAFANIVLVFSFALFGLYDSRTEREGGPDILIRAFQATSVAAIILMASTYITSQTVYSRILVGLFCLLTIALATLLRMVLRRLHLLVRAGSFDLRRVVIVGRGQTAQRMAGRILGSSELGYDLVGLVDAGGETVDSGVPVIGELDALPELIEEQRIGEVIFAEPGLSNERVADFLLRARRSAVDVKMVSGLAGILTQRARVEEFLDLPIVSFEREALLHAGAGVKRLVDVLAAVILIAAWSPVLAVTAGVTAFSGRGCPFGSEPRVGLRGSAFGMRTFKRAERAGRLRRFAVRHGLDGFPKLVNVLRGEMSLVGPEPLTPSVADSLDARARLRFDARPGICALSNVSLLETSPSGDDSIALEAYYVQSWSLGGDLRIALRWLARCVVGRCGRSEEAEPVRLSGTP